jgi:hypothetical protein
MQQIREAFPWEHGCRCLLRDRDAIYGDDWVAMTKGLGMEAVAKSVRGAYPPCPFVAFFKRQTAFIRHRQAAASDAINSDFDGGWDSVLNVILASPRGPGNRE